MKLYQVVEKIFYKYLLVLIIVLMETENYIQYINMMNVIDGI
jgi:hypothetical protein